MGSTWQLPQKTSTTEHAAKSRISDALATKHEEALIPVLRLLKAQGVRAFTVHTVGLKLYGDGRPTPRGGLKRHAPELVAYHEAGWVVATVFVGQRSRCYLVSLPTADVTSQIVDVDQPHVVANMILTTARGENHGTK